MGSIIKKIKSYIEYKKDFKALRHQQGNDTQFPFAKKRMILNEKYEQSGIMSGHYFHQDLLVARKIFERSPQRHVDIGSRTDGFVAHVAAFRPIEVFDIREQVSKVKNIIFTQADLTALPTGLINYCDSISSLHAIEHFGLGRYGDAIDYNGHLKALENIYRILQPGGTFYFSTPIGPQRIEFNAHRVFSLGYLLPLLKQYYQLKGFAYVDDAGDLHEDVALDAGTVAANFGCHYGCGIFELKKPV
jgi:SAM-dependent methyltransferase